MKAKIIVFIIQINVIAILFYSIQYILSIIGCDVFLAGYITGVACLTSYNIIGSIYKLHIENK